jgi:DNA-binding NarL/FixJ family response regulator
VTGLAVDGPLEAEVTPRFGGAVVLICERQAAFGDALREALSDLPGIARAAAATSVSDAASEAARIQPNVAVVADRLPDADPISAARAIRGSAARCSIIVLASDEDAAFVIEGARDGVRGLVTRRSRLSEFVRAVEAVLEDTVALSPSVMAEVLDELVRAQSRQRSPDDVVGRLTAREREVLLLLAEGHGKDEIAKRLFISPETARTHLQNVFAKLGVRSKHQAVALVMRNDRLRLLREDRSDAGGAPSANDGNPFGAPKRSRRVTPRS